MTKQIALALVVLLLCLGAWQWWYLRQAHSTFDNYYAFRGCQQLVSKTDDSGTCITHSGQTITIVKYQDKWYLQGDLPWACITPTFCVGW